MECTIKVLPVGCGDAIIIHYGEKDNFHNIVIDGGYMQMYESVLRPELQAIKDRNESIDLWCITHVDLDHVGGVIKFLRDKEFSKEEKEKLVTQYWFNYSPEIKIEVPPQSTETAYKQGIELREYLKSINQLEEKNIVALDEYEFSNAKLTILSPKQEHLEKLIREWSDEERPTIIEDTETSQAKDDYNMPWGTLVDKKFSENKGTPNKSSISFLFEYHGLKVLFLADSVPSVILESLDTLGYSETTPLPVHYVKLSHHGSKENTSQELLKAIDCSDFIICGNGTGRKYRLPYKQTLVKILEIKPNARFIFSCDDSPENEILETIFTPEEKKDKNINDFYYADIGKPFDLSHEIEV